MAVLISGSLSMKITVLSSRFAGKTPSQLVEMARNSPSVTRDVVGHVSSYSWPPREALKLFINLYREQSVADVPELTKASLKLIRQNMSNLDRGALLALLKEILSHCDRTGSCDHSDESALQAIALSDDSAGMAAYMFMTNGTPLPVVDAIAQQYGLLPERWRGAEGTGIFRMFLAQMKELEGTYGMVWNNNNSGIVIGKAAMKNGWRSNPIPALLESTKYHPDSLVAIAYNPTAVFGRGLPESQTQPAPSYVRNKLLSMKATMGSFTNIEAIQAILSCSEDILTEDAASILEHAVVGMAENPSLSEMERVKLYRKLMEDPLSHPSAASKLRLALASTGSKQVFDLMADDFIRNPVSWKSDSIMAFTGNLDFSVPAYDVIFPVIESHGLEGSADERFLAFAKAMHEMGSNERAVEMLTEMQEEMSGTDVFGSFPGTIAALVKTADWSDKKKAIVMMFLSVMMGMMTLPTAMRSFGVSGSEVAQNLDLQRDADILIMRKSLDDLKTMIAAETEAAKQRSFGKPAQLAPKPPAKSVESRPRRWYEPAKAEGEPKSTNVTQELLNTVLSLEYDPRKQVSSKGAAGDMQLMEPTWNELNRKHFAGKYPWNKYRFDSKVNRMFGQQYLVDIKTFLDANRDKWKTDQVPLMLASYHGGIGNISRCGFDPAVIMRHLPKTYDYMSRGSSLMGYQEIPLYD